MAPRPPSSSGSRPRTLKSQRVSVSGDSELAAKPAVTGPASMTDRFTVDALLGEGGMGAVFVAQDRGLGRVVAIKRLRQEFEGDRGALRRFVLEAQIGAQLEHPNIVPLYSLERTPDGSPVIAMQLLEGRTMGTYIADASVAHAWEREPRGAYSLKERVGTLLGVCDAIQFAHDRGVIHRDLKPDNVMLGENREVYVMDWGLARVQGSQGDTLAPGASAVVAAPPPAADEMDDGAAATIVPRAVTAAVPVRDDALATRQGQVMGTPQYMAPEQAQGRIDEVGPAADQYALGVMLLELSTLKNARSHTSSTQALSEAADGRLEIAVDVDDQPLPPALVAIVARATRKQPGERYPSVRALADDLRRFIRDEPVSVYQEGLSRRTVRLAARRPVLATGLVAGIILLAACALIVMLVRSARQAEQRAYDLEGSRRVLVAVSGRAHLIDVRLSDLAATVEAIAAAAVQSLALDGGEGLPASAERPLPPLTVSAAYGGSAVSFAQQVVAWPGKGTGTPPPSSADRLFRLEPWLRRTVLSGLPVGDRALAPEAMEAALVAGKGTLLRGFVGLEDGSFTQLPAREIPPEHDARQRPWYGEAKQDPSLHWMRPIVDMAGKTLRLTAVVALQDAQGRFLGVAGTDMKESVLAKELALELPGFRRAYLVTEDGKIAVSDDLKARVLSTKYELDAAPELPALEDAALASRLASGNEGGYLQTADGRLLVYARLISPPWTYVAEFDAAPYLTK